MSYLVASPLQVCVVGTGALGTALLERLRVHGYRSVLLVDPDVVESRNLCLSPLLQRAVLVQQNAEGHADGPAVHKAEALAAAANALDKLPWRSETCELADVGWELLREVDLICCCTDSTLSRVETAWTARSLGLPVLDGAVFGQGLSAGRVTAFPAAEIAACYLCGLSEDRRAQVLGEAASTSFGCRVAETVEAMTGTLATLEAVADAMLQVLMCWPEFPVDAARATRITRSPDGSWSREDHRLTRSSSCPWHEGTPGILYPLPWETPLRNLLQGDSREVVLNWPICTEALCSACGARSKPMQRVARVRRAPCRTCGKRQLQPVRALQSIRHGDAAGDFSPRQLGMPSQHLYWVRETSVRLARQEAAV